MKPILLTMQAFGSYGEKTEIDFQKGGDFFLISGDTGSGKSTIFDAMMFALYGEVSTNGSGKENELLSQFVDVRNDKPLVSLVFTAHQHGQEETYKITRTPRHIRPAKRTGAKQQEEGETAELLMPDGSQYPGKLSETNRKIEELVGLTADQFRKVVMIAQGEFMDFLRAGSKEKTELLRDLLKTDYYYQLSERLKTLAKEKNTAAKTQRANMSFFAGRAVTEGLPEEDAQALEAAKGTVITAKELQPEQVDTLAEVLSGEVGDHIVTMRRSGDVWYVGGLAGWDGRSIRVDLSLLPEGTYAVELFRDGENAARIARDYVREEFLLAPGKSFDVKMFPGGGFAARITKR